VPPTSFCLTRYNGENKLRLPVRRRTKRKNKYRAIRVEVDGIRFASKREAREYGKLKILLQAGEIVDLELQPSWTIVINNIKVCVVKMDFAYTITATGVREVVDVKGMDNPVSKLKRKLLLACHGVETTLVR